MINPKLLLTVNLILTSMALILSIITAPIIYLGLGWVASSIYYSVKSIEESASLHDIMSTSIFIYACIAAAYNGLMGLYASDTEKDENITGWLGLGQRMG